MIWQSLIIEYLNSFGKSFQQKYPKKSIIQYSMSSTESMYCMMDVQSIGTGLLSGLIKYIKYQVGILIHLGEDPLNAIWHRYGFNQIHHRRTCTSPSRAGTRHANLTIISKPYKSILYKYRYLNINIDINK